MVSRPPSIFPLFVLGVFYLEHNAQETTKTPQLATFKTTNKRCLTMYTILLDKSILVYFIRKYGLICLTSVIKILTIV